MDLLFVQMERHAPVMTAMRKQRTKASARQATKPVQPGHGAHARDKPFLFRKHVMAKTTTVMVRSTKIHPQKANLVLSAQESAIIQEHSFVKPMALVSSVSPNPANPQQKRVMPKTTTVMVR
jgi:hypothetical protein